MKKLILSLLVLTLNVSFAQTNTTENSTRILVDSGSQTWVLKSQDERLHVIRETIQSIEGLYKLNTALNAKLDTLLSEKKRLKNQNYTLKIRNQQLKKYDQLAVAQNIKLIRHNEILILRNDRKIVHNACLIQKNQTSILANEQMAEQQILMFENFAIVSK